MQHIWRWVALTLAILGVPTLMGVNGCSSPLSVSEGSEVDIGRQAAAQVEAQYGVVRDPAMNARVERIGMNIAGASSRRNLPWRFRIVNIEDVNAFALPGGPVYVTRGLLAQGVSDAELAGVLGHEVAHTQLRHGAKAIERAMQYSLLQQLALGGRDGALQAATDIAIQLALELPHSRGDEYQADAVGTRLAYNAGYPADGLLAFLRRLQATGGTSRTPSWLRTHPLTQDRITRESQLVASLQGQSRPVPVALTAEEERIAKALADAKDDEAIIQH